MKSSTADHWNGIYESKDASDLSWYQQYPATSLRLIESAALDRDRTLVDVGAGTSTLADELVELGYSAVVVSDISAAAVALTRQRLADAVDYVVGSVLELDIGPVAMWHDRAVFHFLTDPGDRNRYKAVLENHVAAGDHAIVATFAADGGEMCSGLPVTRHSPEELAAAFSPEFELVESCREEHITPSGSMQPFTFVLLRRESQP